MSPIEGLVPAQKLRGLATALTDAGIPHAFGGAIALGYASEPRGTLDLDINIFLAVREVPRVFALLGSHGIATSPELEREAITREQVRLDWEGTAVDLFFAYDPLHHSCELRARTVGFSGQPIRVLSGEDIVLFKTLYNRPKDWPDIEQLLAVQGPNLDAAYVRDWIGRMLPAADSARTRLEALLIQYSDQPA